MNKIIAGIAALIVLIIGGYYVINKMNESDAVAENPQPSDMGIYDYRCEGDIEFGMTPSANASSLTLFPKTNASFVQTVVTRTGTSTGAHYEGGTIIFVGAGEGVTLTVNGTAIGCEPKQNANPDMAPFNWGDAAEGGGVKQDAGKIVSGSIAGVWKSNDDAKFNREFKPGGSVVDSYQGKTVSTGTWKTFTKDKPKSVAFPIEEGAVYVQLNMQGSQANTLNFKVAKLTPDALDMVYMGKGTVLTFVRVR